MYIYIHLEKKEKKIQMSKQNSFRNNKQIKQRNNNKNNKNNLIYKWKTKQYLKKKLLII